MPAKNAIKQYVENGYYHIYNRGVKKRIIFQDQLDYSVFLLYLKQYLMPKNEHDLSEKLLDPSITPKERDKILKLLRLNNFYNELTFLAFCLMPNHFHFLVKQKQMGTINIFMKSLCTRYSMYFNKRYKRVGPLYQDVYKAVLVTNEAQFLHLSRYIHKQALRLQGASLEAQPCSYFAYLGTAKIEWVDSNEILSFFSKTNPKLSYQSFVEQKDDFSVIHDIVLEDET